MHALAAFGLLRLGDRLRPGLRLGWCRSAANWYPVFSGVGDESQFIDDVAAALQALSVIGTVNSGAGRRVRDLNALLKKRREALKKAEKAAKSLAKVAGLKGAELKSFVQEQVAPVHAESLSTACELAAAQSTLSSANGRGVAHFGDNISVDPKVFRAAADNAIEAWFSSPSTPVAGDDAVLAAAQLAALGCDQIVAESKVLPTPYSFSNGASAQYLLKDFRACAADVSPLRLRATFRGELAARVKNRTSLNWDPGEQKSYALDWYAPEDVDKWTDVGANALAYLGISLLPAVPVGSRLRAVGWLDSGAFVWPIWEHALPVDAVTSLLAMRGLSDDADEEALRARGVVELRMARKINPDGKRNYFAPSRSIG